MHYAAFRKKFTHFQQPPENALPTNQHDSSFGHHLEKKRTTRLAPRHRISTKRYPRSAEEIQLVDSILGRYGGYPGVRGGHADPNLPLGIVHDAFVNGRVQYAIGGWMGL
jgi:hypothetical protein